MASDILDHTFRADRSAHRQNADMISDSLDHSIRGERYAHTHKTLTRRLTVDLDSVRTDQHTASKP